MEGCGSGVLNPKVIYFDPPCVCELGNVVTRSRVSVVDDDGTTSSSPTPSSTVTTRHSSSYVEETVSTLTTISTADTSPKTPGISRSRTTMLTVRHYACKERRRTETSRTVWRIQSTMVSRIGLRSPTPRTVYVFGASGSRLVSAAHTRRWDRRWSCRGWSEVGVNGREPRNFGARGVPSTVREV